VKIVRRWEVSVTFRRRDRQRPRSSVRRDPDSEVAKVVVVAALVEVVKG
jgi:hypothetical protein